MEAYGDGYMEPEEEWEREGLLDPAWEKQQKKVSENFTLLLFKLDNNFTVKNNINYEIKLFQECKQFYIFSDREFGCTYCFTYYYSYKKQGVAFLS